MKVEADVEKEHSEKPKELFASGNVIIIWSLKPRQLTAFSLVNTKHSYVETPQVSLVYSVIKIELYVLQGNKLMLMIVWKCDIKKKPMLMIIV